MTQVILPIVAPRRFDTVKALIYTGATIFTELYARSNQNGRKTVRCHRTTAA